jgi:uncharacterized protein YjgD (DUF1641 family)
MGAEVIKRSGMGDELNFVPTDPHTLQSKNWENVWIIGDAADVPTSKAGSVAHFMLDVLIENLLRHMEGLVPLPKFDGHANCFIESGFEKGILIDFNYEVEPLPGKFPLPGFGPFSLLKESAANHWGKVIFRWTYWNVLLKGGDMPFESQMSMMTTVETVSVQEQLNDLTWKVDHLTQLLETQQRRQQDLDELKADLIPIGNQLLKISIDELAEIGTEFQMEDLLFLLKRLLRNTDTLVALLDRLEAGMGLAEEANLIGKQVFSSAVEELDQMERKGYFAFAREGWSIMDRIVTEFSEEDVRALGDNIVTILYTVRNMTQPEILELANKSLAAIRPEEEIQPESVSTWSLLRELSDPKVRVGMARLLNLLKVLADQPPTASDN